MSLEEFPFRGQMDEPSTPLPYGGAVEDCCARLRAFLPSRLQESHVPGAAGALGLPESAVWRLLLNGCTVRERAHMPADRRERPDLFQGLLRVPTAHLQMPLPLSRRF